MPSCHRSSRFAAGPITRGLLCATTLTMAMAMGTAMAAGEAKDKGKGKSKDPAAEEESNSFLSGNELFPDNSILKRVILPTYDEKLQLTNTLTAEELTIVTKKKIEAKNLKIDFFGADRTPRGSMSMTKSSFDAPKNLLTTDEAVTYVSDELNVDGSAMAFDTRNNRGFLHGPVTAVMKTAAKVAANRDGGAKASEKALAKGEAPKEAGAPAPVPAAPAADTPEKPSDPLRGLTLEEKMAAMDLGPDGLQQIKEQAASRAPQAEEARGNADQSLEENQEKSESGRLTMGKFLTLAALVLAEDSAGETDGPVPRPEVTVSAPGVEKTTITSDNGAFMDNTAGLIIFLKNVKVVNPEFTMTATKEVKAFMKVDPAAAGKTKEEMRAEMEKRAADKAARKAEAEKNGTAKPEGDGTTPAPAPGPAPLPKPPEGTAKTDKPQATPEQLEKWRADKEKKKSEGLGGSGDISRLIATGTVLIDYKPKPPEDKKEKPKDPVKAAARVVIYNFEKEEILLQGGSPWVVIGDKLVSVDGENSYIQVLLKDGQPIYAVTKGGSLKAELEIDSMKEKKEGDKAKPEDKPQGGAKPPGPGANKPQNGAKPAGNGGAKPNHR